MKIQVLESPGEGDGSGYKRYKSVVIITQKGEQT